MAGTGARPSSGSAGPSGNGPEMTPREAADYIGSLLDGLRVVAHNANLPFLAYLIAVALEEAKSAKAGREGEGRESQG